MKWHARRVSRQWLVALAIITGLVAVGLLLSGVSQPVSAGVPAPLDGSYKSASADKVSPGAVFTYTIVLSNSSTSSVGPVTVTDALPDEVEYVSLSTFVLPEGSAYPDFDDGKRHITFTVPTIGANALITVGFRAQVGESVPADTVITNTAVISDGSEALNRSVVVTVEAAPTAKILSPWQNQTITERNQFSVTGRVWTAAQTPEFPGTPTLNSIICPPRA